jgi:TatD DNase family protein
VEEKIVLVDTHCHLDAAEFDADRDAVFNAAKVGAGGTASVETIVIPAVERANFGAVASVCHEYSGCVPAYGIHPMYVDRARPEDLDALGETLAREPAVAVGEIGLDHHVEPRDDARQAFYFIEQLKIARAFDLPALLHVRKAIDPILKHLRENRVRGGIAHAFNGSRQQADEFIKLGFKLGFGGAMTFAGSKRIRELASCWKPMRRTFPRRGKTAAEILRPTCCQLPKHWQNCASCRWRKSRRQRLKTRGPCCRD